MVKYYKIAGLTVQMDTFGKTQVQAEPYLADRATLEAMNQPDVIIPSNWERLKKTQPHLSEETCEYLSTGADFYSRLLRFDGTVLHSSAVVMDGRAYLFSAPCGTGKSTHTKLWQKVFGEDRAQILNDDKPALRLEDGIFYAYGTPWSGKTAQNLNLRVPLAGICVLRRGAVNKIEPFGGPQAIHALLAQTVRPRDPELMQLQLDMLDALIQKVPIWKLECNMDPEAAIVSYSAMSGKDRKELE